MNEMLQKAIEAVKARGAQAAAEVKAHVPQGIKDHIRTIDWSKVVTPSDKRNAAIGATLGGLVLGGASLAREKDPEESKLTPVGDALIGALAGGAAGYGIPKGLSIFRSPGSVSPNKEVTGLDRYLPAGAKGALVGLGAFGAQTVKDTLAAGLRVKNRVGDMLDNGIGQEVAKRRLAYAESRLKLLTDKGATAARIRQASKAVLEGRARVDAFLDEKGFTDAVRLLKRDINRAKIKRDAETLMSTKLMLKRLLANRAQLTKVTPSKVWNELATDVDGREVYGSKLLDWPSTFIRNRIRGRGYAARPGKGMATRALGKYMPVGVISSLALERFFGPGAQDNFAPRKD